MIPSPFVNQFQNTFLDLDMNVLWRGVIASVSDYLNAIHTTDIKITIVGDRRQEMRTRGLAIVLMRRLTLSLTNRIRV